MKIITYMQTLMDYAKKLGKARQSKDKDKIKIAEKNHDAYKNLCLKSNKIIIGRKIDFL